MEDDEEFIMNESSCKTCKYCVGGNSVKIDGFTDQMIENLDARRYCTKWMQIIKPITLNCQYYEKEK